MPLTALRCPPHHLHHVGVVYSVSPVHRPRTAPFTAAATGLVLLGALSITGCGDIVAAHGDSPAEARVTADAHARGWEYRFTAPARDPRYEHARLRIAQYAMAPSPLLKGANDTLWTRSRGGVHELIGVGAFVADARTGRAGRYALATTPTPVPPAAIAASVHRITLTPLGNDDYRWRTQVDHALGTVTPEQVRGMFHAMLKSAERPAAEIRADYRAASARLTGTMGELATLDTVRTVRHADGSTSVTLGIALHPERIKQRYPDFSKYLSKYVSSARYEWALRDLPPLNVARSGGAAVPDATRGARTGATANTAAENTWFVATARNDLLMIRFRTKDGALQPLAGALRAMPDTVALHGEAFAKFGPFTVGMSNLKGRFAFVRSSQEVGWHMTFTREPEWHLPPVTSRLVRTPLRRPFEGDGSMFRVTAQRLSTGQTVAHRVAATTVHESALMRWIGALGFTAMDDFAGRVEQDEARFIAAAMRAWRLDIPRAIGSPGDERKTPLPISGAALRACE